MSDGMHRPAANVDGPPATVIDASSVLLLRDGDDGLEVFVVERHQAGAFAGLLAYPGGKVDDTDRDLPDDRFTGLDLDALLARYGLAGEPDGPARVKGWMVAAVREAFEEVGVLLAHRRTAAGLVPLTADDLASPSFLDARARLVQRGVPWDWTAWLDQESLVLDLGALGPWSRWITPKVEPRRFDTGFFLAVVPPAQADVLEHDQVEVVDSRWLTPQAILAEREAGTSVVIYPTRRQLPGLGTSCAEAMAASAVAHLGPIQPTIEVDGDQVLAHHPLDGSTESVF